MTPRFELSRRTLLLSGMGAAAALRAGHAKADTYSLCVVGKNGWLFPIWDAVQYSRLSEVNRVSRFIADAVARLRAARINVAIVLLPSKSRVYRDQLPDNVKMSADALRRYDVALANLAASGAVVPDLAGLFDAYRKQHPQADLFFRADTHWLPIASELAAIATARAIKAKISLPPSSQPGVTLAPPHLVTQERNDLAALLPPAERAKYPFEQYQLQSAAATNAAAALTQSDTADVLVMGNSFMQPAYGFAPMLSSQLNRPVALDWKVHQFSPYWMMVNYLQSDTFKKQRPNLIVWTFEESDMEVDSAGSDAWGPNAMPPATFLSQLNGLLAA